jgi:hypothetical protein
MPIRRAAGVPYLKKRRMENSYILITAAKNEEDNIGEALRSVVSQTVLPRAWFIMDDGSTDHTAEIVAKCARANAFIRLQTLPARRDRNFAGQYAAIQEGYKLAAHYQYDFIGVHDADIAPERSDYYETLLRRFNRNPQLGMAGGYIHERQNGHWKCRNFNSPESVAGGVQMFRRRCFEEIGGYKPLRLGGSDWLAQLEVTMKGWEVEVSTELAVRHYRPTSSANGRLRGWFREGQLAASFGSHGLFEIVKCARRAALGKPFMLGAMARTAGFLSWRFAGKQPLIDPEAVHFLRQQQMRKLKARIKLPFNVPAKAK